MNHFKGVEYFICAVENYAIPENFTKVKVVLFLEYSDTVHYSYVSNVASTIFPTTSEESPWSKLKIKRSKSRKTALINCSKKDFELYTNIEIDNFCFTYRVHEWAKRTTEFDHCDLFVAEHRNNYRFLKEYLNDAKRPKFLTAKLRPYEFTYNNWTSEVISWWNNKIKDNRPRQKQMYIHGQTGLGKSTFVQILIGRAFLPYVFYPEKGDFFMQEFSAERHKVIVFEEYNIKDFPTNYLKRLLAGELYSYSVKAQQPKMIKFTGPIIFVSNFLEIEDAALMGRLKIVEANKKFWEDQRLLLAKEEPAEIEISQPIPIEDLTEDYQEELLSG